MTWSEQGSSERSLSCHLSSLAVKTTDPNNTDWLKSLWEFRICSFRIFCWNGDMLIFGPTNFDPPQKQIHNQTYTIKNQKCTLEKMSIWSHLFIRHCTVYFFFIKFFIFVQPMGLKYFSVFFFRLQNHCYHAYLRLGQNFSMAKKYCLVVWFPY